MNKALKKLLDKRMRRQKAPICKPGKHRLEVTGMNGKVKCLSCTKCLFTVDVPLTSTERRMWDKRHKAEKARIKAIHSLGWAYQREFYKYDTIMLSDEEFAKEQERVKMFNKSTRKLKLKASRSRQVHRGFKWSGWELMERLRKFAKKHPQVQILGCDDNYHASSTVCVIPHACKEESWGLTVVIAPQMGGFPATEFFLYPSHAQPLAEALSAFAGEAKAKEKAAGWEEWKYGGWWPDASIPNGFKAEGL
jgi:hypothetical protein